MGYRGENLEEVKVYHLNSKRTTINMLGLELNRRNKLHFDNRFNGDTIKSEKGIIRPLEFTVIKVQKFLGQTTFFCVFPDGWNFTIVYTEEGYGYINQ